MKKYILLLILLSAVSHARVREEGELPDPYADFVEEAIGDDLQTGLLVITSPAPIAAGGTVTHDQACSAGAASGTSVSGTCVPTGGTNPGVVFGLSLSSKTITGLACTWNGVSVPQIGSNCVNGSNASTSAQFGLINPASGSHTYSCTWTSAAVSVLGAEFVTHANQTTLTTGQVCNTSAAGVTPQTVTTSPGPASGDLIIDTLTMNGGGVCPTAGATQRWAIRQSFTVGGCGQTGTANPMQWTGATDSYEDLGVNIQHD